MTVALLAVALSACATEGEPGRPGATSTSTDALGPCVTPSVAANEVEIFFDVPSKLVTSGYSGEIPVTFGVPFPEGELDEDAFLDIYQGKPSSCRRPAQFHVTGVWQPDGPNTSVKWLLVDALVEMVGGAIEPVFLQYDNGLAPWSVPSFPWTTGFAARVAQSGGAPTTALSAADVGEFYLVTDGLPGTPGLESYDAEPVAPVVETSGPVRTVLRVDGSYARSGPVQRLAQFTTRYTLFKDQPFVKVLHTMVWGRDDDPPHGPLAVPPADELGFDYSAKIGKLSYRVPGVSTATCGTVSTPTESSALSHSCAAHVVQQEDELNYSDNGVNAAGHLIGYASVDNTGATEDVFVGLRWMSEQYPSGLRYDPSLASPLQVDLLAGGWEWKALAENGLTSTGGGVWGCHTQPNHPAGIAKTYELWLWPDSVGTVTDDQKATLLEGGVVAYPDPSFAVQAELPSPMSACHGCTKSAGTPSSEIEEAMSDAFHLFERAHEPATPETTSRLGAFHFGDAFYKTPSSLGSNRYWMNHGAHFSSVPWMLWMRSGERRYRDYADAQARHLSDVDHIHIDRELAGLSWCGSGTPSGRKNKGFQGQFDHLHTGFTISPLSAFDVAGKTSDSEGLALSYHLTGDERLLEVLRQRAQALADRWTTPDGGCADVTCDAGSCQLVEQLYKIRSACLTQPTGSPKATYGYKSVIGGQDGPGNGPVFHYAVLGELLVLYEATASDPSMPLAAGKLKAAAEAYLDEILRLQQADGDFPGAYRSVWLLESLQRARRVLPARAADVTAAISRFDDHEGSLEDPGPSGGMLGTPSVTSALARYDHTGDERSLRRAEALAYSQALAIRGASTTSGSGEEWVGVAPGDPNEVGPLIRGWLQMDALYAAGVVGETNLHRLAHLHAPMGSLTNRLREVFYSPRSHDEALVVATQFYRTGIERKAADISLLDPQGVVQASSTACIERKEHRHGVDLPGSLSVHAEDTTGDSFISTGCGTSPVGVETMEAVLPAGTGPGGVYRTEITIDEAVDGAGALAPSSVPPLPAVKSWRVIAQNNHAIQFDGLSDYVQVASHPVFDLRPKMTVAFRYASAGVGNQTILTQPYQYQAYIVGSNLTVRFYLTDGVSSTVTPAHSIPVGATATVFEGVVASLFFDARTGDTEVRICTEGGGGVTCSSSSYSYPGHFPHVVAHPFTVGRNGTASNGYFDGMVDDVRVLPRWVYEHEAEAYLVGSANWDIDLGGLGGGEALLFDGSLAGVANELAVAHGVEGVDFSYVSQPTDTRVARPAKQVLHFAPSGCGSAAASVVNNGCYVRGPAVNAVGAVDVVGSGGAVEVCQRSTYVRNEFGVVGPTGVFEATSQLTSNTPPTVLCAADASVSAGDERSLLVQLNSDAPRFATGGIEPLFASQAGAWFDALSCEENDVVGRFVDEASPAPNQGYLSVGNPTLGNAYTMSFQMKAPALPTGFEYVLAKRYQFRVYIMSGKVWVHHYGAGGSPVLSAPYPADSWVEVSATAEFSGGVISSRLYLNGVLVDESEVGATGFNLPSTPFDILLGKQHTTDATSFSGLLDDFRLQSGIHPPDPSDEGWFLCRPSFSGMLASETFEGCPSGGTLGYDNAARSDGTILTSCP